MKNLLTLLVCMLLAACGASGPGFRPEPGLRNNSGALLYLYRPDTMIGILNADVPIIYLDGQRLGRIRINGYMALPIAAGTHTVATTESLLGRDTNKVRGETTFRVEAGATVYLRYTENFKSITPIVLPNTVVLSSTGDYRFTPVPEHIGLQELQSSKRLEQERP